ncbi:MAG: hypothetical protein J5I90_20670 [Caldilineales bacterium]|nr:hypothetical protein [Caldilineales bacterium]
MTAQTQTNRTDGISIIAIYFFLSGFLSLMSLCGLMFLGYGIFFNVDDTGSQALALVGLSCGLVIVLAAGLASLIVGYGVWNMRSWARWAAIVLAVLALPGFPIGTVIGILIIWYLLKDDVRPLFENP